MSRLSWPRARRVEPAAPLTDEAQRWLETSETIRRAVAGKGTIVAGPWLSEVGFEVLYWVPFLRFLVERFEIDPARIVIVSRGGTASWYQGIGSSYLDVFDYMTPAEFRAHMQARWDDLGGQKQDEFDKWDRAVLERAGGRLSWDRRSLLHPSLMYGLFRKFWKGGAPVDHVFGHTKVVRLPQPPQDEWTAKLPDEDYVAVKFYFRPSFPDVRANRAAVQQAVARLTANTPVVALNTGLELDDHAEAAIEARDRVIPLLDGVPPNVNLHVQSVAISRARAFVGTYGGLSYLAPLYGIRSIAFYSDRRHFLSSHLAVARRAAIQTGGSLETVSTRHTALLETLAPVDGRAEAVPA